MDMIKRDIPSWRFIQLPETQESWYEYYCTLQEKDAQELELHAAQFSKAMNGFTSQKAKQIPKVVNAKKLGLPQEKPTNMQKYANFDRRMGGLEPVFIKPPPPKPGDRGIHPDKKEPLMFLATPKMRDEAKLKPKKSALPVVRRNRRLFVPTHKLNTKASAIFKAPKSFVEDYRIERRVVERYGGRKLETEKVLPPNGVKASSSEDSRRESAGTRQQVRPSPARPQVRPVASSMSPINTNPPAVRQTPAPTTQSSPSVAPRQRLSPISPDPATCRTTRLIKPNSASPSPPKRRAPANPLLMPKRRPVPPPAQRSTNATAQPTSIKRPAESRVDDTPLPNPAKKQRVS